MFSFKPGHACGGFRPVVDGAYLTEGPFLPASPLDLLQSKTYNVVPQIVGLNEDDASIFAAAGISGKFEC